MKLVMALIVMSLSLSAFAQYRERVYPVACDGRDLISNHGRTIYSFTFSSDCTDALAEARSNRGRFCDGSRLVKPSGIIAHQFTFNSDCQEALGQLRGSRTGLFCNSSNLNHIRYGLILYMSFESDCKRAVEEARMYRGFFCNGSQMYNNYGQLLNDYTWTSDCQRALRNITHGRSTF